MKKKTARRAVHIAAVVMECAGMCRFEDRHHCRKDYPSEEKCVDCIEKWLLKMARRELEGEG